MIARLVWIALLGVIGAITAQLQFDRQSARDPAMGDWVAAPFRAYAQHNAVLAGLPQEDSAQVLAEAKRLAERRPIPAENLSLLAQAYVKVGNGEAATVTMQNAAQRGWRDPVAQEVMARLAIAFDDMPEATRRFTALMVLDDTNTPLLRDLASAIFADPASPGFATLSEIVSGTDRWSKVFIRRGSHVMPPAAFVEVVAASMARGATFDCTSVSRSLRVVARSDVAAATRLVATTRATCPGIEADLKPRRGRVTAS